MPPQKPMHIFDVSQKPMSPKNRPQFLSPCPMPARVYVMSRPARLRSHRVFCCVLLWFVWCVFVSDCFVRGCAVVVASFRIRERLFDSSRIHLLMRIREKQNNTTHTRPHACARTTGAHPPAPARTEPVSVRTDSCGLAPCPCRLDADSPDPTRTESVPTRTRRPARAHRPADPTGARTRPAPREPHIP